MCMFIQHLYQNLIFVSTCICIYSLYLNIYVRRGNFITFTFPNPMHDQNSWEMKDLQHYVTPKQKQAQLLPTSSSAYFLNAFDQQSRTHQLFLYHECILKSGFTTRHEAGTAVMCPWGRIVFLPSLLLVPLLP